MSSEAPPAKKGPKGPGPIKRLLSLPKRISAAGCASCLTSIFLVLLVATVWLLFFLDPNNVPWRHSMSWPRIAIQTALVIAIPIFLYRTLRLWLEGDKSRFPDIDYAWRSGIEALERNGLSVRSAPLFLVLGSESQKQEKALIRSAGLSLRVNEVPEGPAPVHWYANPEGIYLFCSETSWSSALAGLIEKKKAEGLMGPDGEIPVPMAVVEPTPSQPAAAAPGVNETGRGTIMLDQFFSDQTQSQPRSVTSTTSMSEATATQITMVGPAREDVTLTLAPHESAEQVQRLYYVCQLLRQARAPLCPVNGVLTLVPFDLLQGRPRQVQELQRAVRTDLITIQRELRMRCPVTALVVGMQNERGFREIVRRVGRERTATQRFGRKYDVRIVATAEQLANLCVHVCGVFEDWIHTLFREAGALSRPGNTRLYSLLCKIRVNMQNTLREFLGGAFGFDEQQKDLDEPLAFSGCYFAATGDTEDQQAFVKGVFEKLAEEQEEVEWTKRAVRTNQRYLTFTMINVLATGILAITIGVVAIYRLLK